MERPRPLARSSPFVVAACCLLACVGAAADDAHRPASGPATAAPSTRPADPAMQAAVDAGRAAAERDLAAGVLRYRQGIPETFLLGWMTEESGGGMDRLAYFGALLE